MRKLIESTFVSLDGTMSAPRKWSPPYADEELAVYASNLLFSSDALLLGRKTYELFAKAWPARSGDPYTDRINSMPKYVASRTLKDTTWNASVIGDQDLVADVTRLKEQPGGWSLLKLGTGELSKALFKANLVDEYHFWIFPVIAGTGDRLFDGLDLTHLELLDTTPFKSGVVVMKYAPKQDAGAA